MGWLAWRIPPLDQPGVPRESPGVPAPQFAMVFHGVAALTIPLTPPHRYKRVAAQQTAAYANTPTETSYLRDSFFLWKCSKLLKMVLCCVWVV